MSERRYYESNCIIRASAGTGKTFALATRFIRLMLLDGVPPSRIVALTFSRAAAQEIYTKILDRLCDAAATEGGAEKEWNLLLEDFRNNLVPNAAVKLASIEKSPPPHAAVDFAALLRRLTDTQHLGAIATLDSFILKIVRNFPKEMGFQNAVTVLDPVDENAAVCDAVQSALSRTDGSTADVAKAFRDAKSGENPRQCLDAIANILGREGWRNFVIAHPECIDGERRWTVEYMAHRLGVDLHSVCPDLSGIPFNDMRYGRELAPEEHFVRHAQAYDGSGDFFPSNSKAVELMRHFWNDRELTVHEYDHRRNHYRFDCGPEGAAAIRGAIRHMINVYLKHQLEIVVAKIRLVEVVEIEYERMTRRMGKLTFADFTKYSSDKEFSDRGIALQNVEFRFDAKFDHWALDEFQDTSELQWKCLHELVSNAADDGRNDESRTVMAVGDMKQSIYTWRGASAQPFEDIAAWPAFDGCTRNLSDSHRYGPAITEFVNKVFGKDNIKAGGIIPAACDGAVTAWREGWVDHESREPQDYVKVIAATSDGNDEDDGEILPALGRELKELWHHHQLAGSTDTVGVLVRNNDHGRRVADYLRNKCSLPVVWEGIAPVNDNPVVMAVLALLKFAEHTSDSAAWETARKLFDIVSVLLPGVHDAAGASEAVAGLLARQGLSRTLKDWCVALRSCGRFAEDGLTSAKLRQLVELAVAFEDRCPADGSMMAFAEFVEQSGIREIAASSEVVRVLTIHRSKGLGIDHVFVPMFEDDRSRSAIDAPKSSAPLFNGGEWVLSHLQKGSEHFNSNAEAAYSSMRCGCFAEALRTYYVALTRAKKSMYVIFPDEDSLPPPYAKGLLMRDLIRSAVGDVFPYELGVMPNMDSKHRDTDNVGCWPAVGSHEVIERVSPSRGGCIHQANGNVAELFDSEYGDAARRGVDLHAAYAAIEWIDADDESPAMRKILASDFRDAFVKPMPEATVWRERNYEIYSSTQGTGRHSTWETGQFDRVVFTGTGDNRKAVIYDFKTNAMRSGETDVAFSERMVNTYRSQMSSYRYALHILTKIPLDRIETRLLLETTGQSVSV